MQLKISAIVCTRNRFNDLVACLNSIKKQTVAIDECILIEDVSEKQNFTQASLEAFFSNTIPCIYKSTTKKSIAHSRNMGITSCSSDVLLFLDDDVTFGTSLVETLHNLHTQQPNTLGFVGKILPQEVNDISEFASWYSCRTLLHEDKQIPIKYYPTMTISLRLDALKKNKIVFNQNLNTTCEDVDLLLQLYQKGERLVFSPEVVSFHNFRSSYFKAFKRYIEYAKNFAYLAKTYPDDFSIEQYLPKRKIHWILFPFFILFNSMSLASQDKKHDALPPDLYYLSACSHLCHMIGIIASMEGRSFLVRKFLQHWRLQHLLTKK